MDAKPIYDITPQTLIDYEGKIASIIWFAGCPLRCIYCHNPQIIKGEGSIGEEDVLAFLKERAGWIDGVVLSGGECCMYDGLYGFCEKIKQLGLSIKVDTSGIRPKTVIELAKAGLIDTVALDFKAPKEIFEAITGANMFNLFERTLKGLLDLKFNISVRTTVYPEYIDEATISKMADILFGFGYQGEYTIQAARVECGTLGDLPKSKREFRPSLVESKLPLSFIGF